MSFLKGKLLEVRGSVLVPMMVVAVVSSLTAITVSNILNAKAKVVAAKQSSAAWRDLRQGLAGYMSNPTNCLNILGTTPPTLGTTATALASRVLDLHGLPDVGTGETLVVGDLQKYSIDAVTVKGFQMLSPTKATGNLVISGRQSSASGHMPMFPIILNMTVTLDAVTGVAQSCELTRAVVNQSCPAGSVLSSVDELGGLHCTKPSMGAACPAGQAMKGLGAGNCETGNQALAEVPVAQQCGTTEALTGFGATGTFYCNSNDPIPVGYGLYAHWSGAWTSNTFDCPASAAASYQVSMNHYDEHDSNNASMFFCKKQPPHAAAGAPPAPLVATPPAPSSYSAACVEVSSGIGTLGPTSAICIDNYGNAVSDAYCTAAGITPSTAGCATWFQVGQPTWSCSGSTAVCSVGSSPAVPALCAQITAAPTCAVAGGAGGGGGGGAGGGGGGV